MFRARVQIYLRLNDGRSPEMTHADYFLFKIYPRARKNYAFNLTYKVGNACCRCAIVNYKIAVFGTDVGASIAVSA